MFYLNVNEMQEIWSYLRNAFETATKRSTKLALMIIIAHKLRLYSLISDPEIQELYDRTKPIHDEYCGKWSDSVTALSMRKSATLAQTLKMKELSKVKVPSWIATVLGVFPEDSPQYKAIFSKGRSPYRSGSIDYRIGIVDSTAKVLKNYPALAALQLDVENTHKSLLQAKELKELCDFNVEKASENLEIARTNVSDIMFGNLGFLINKHYRNPSFIEKYFDLSLMKIHVSNNGTPPEPEPQTGAVPALGTVTLLGGNFDANSYFRIRNTGKTLLKIYTSKLPDDVLPGSAVDVLAGQEVDVFASELGASTNMFLMVHNPDELAEGSYSFLMNEPEEE
jgi:hypothetical protein